MRRLSALSIVFCLVVVLAGCSSPVSIPEQTDSTVLTASSSDIPEPENVSVEEKVLFEQNGLRITLKSLSTEGFMGPSLKVLIENNGSKDVTIQARGSSVNGIMVDTIFSCDVVAGKKANDEISFMSSDLKTAGIETFLEVELKFHVFDSASWADSYDSEVISIQTSAFKSMTQSYDTSGTVILEKDGFKIIAKELNSESSFWGADIYLYIENNSDKDATIQLRDTSVNGFMVSPIFSCDIMAGKKAFDSITFLESDLTENDIKLVEELECSFHVFESEGWETIFDSGIVKVTF